MDMGVEGEHYKVGGHLDSRSFWLVTTPSTSQLSMPYLCTEAGTLFGRQGFFTERARKDSFPLFYTFGGTGIVRQGKRSVTLHHGEALLMDCSAPQTYGTTPDGDHWHHMWAHVQGAGVTATAKRLGLPRLLPIRIPRSRMQPHFDTIFEHLETEGVESGEVVGLAVHGLLSSLLIAKARVEVPDDGPIVLASNFVASHYAEPISVADIARAAAVSTSYLTRLFRQQMATSPHDYLLRYRITRAKQLLMETDLAIGAIARQVGFRNESTFSYRFSKMCDISPRAYRQLRERDS